MKKIFLLPLLFIILLSFVGCSKIKLETGESFVTFNKDSVSVACSVSDKDAKKLYDVRIKDSNKDIKEDLVDYFSDIYDEDIKITEFKKGKDYINFTYELEDAEDIGYLDETTLEDYADDLRYDDVEELADDVEFITYDKEKSVDSDDIDKYEDDLVQVVQGGNKGMYYKAPNKILLVPEKLKYEKISNDTIYIKRNSSGIIVYRN